MAGNGLLIKNYSKLCELFASVVNSFSQKTQNSQMKKPAYSRDDSHKQPAFRHGIFL